MTVNRTHWVLFGLYILICASVFVASLVSPAVRAVAAAPLRDWILPPPSPITITLLYASEEDAWLKEAIQDFQATQPLVGGRSIVIQPLSYGSREMITAILDGKEKPALISPASMLQVSILQDQSAAKFGKAVVNASDTTTCKPVLNTPLVLAAWRERADVLWGQTPPADLWRRLHDDLVNPLGWGAFNKPEWGYVKFGHTSPLTSNSGLMTLLLMTYDYFGKTSGLTSNDLLSNTDYQKWLLEIEGTIPSFGDSTGTYMHDIVAYGPSTYDMVAVYEATAFGQADNAVGRYGELRVYYPPATIISDHPFCVVSADWVSPEQTQAASLFMDYVLSKPIQEMALLKYGFRPVSPQVPLDEAGSPLVHYASTGFQINLPPAVQLPPVGVLNTLLDFWSRNVNR